MGGASTRQSSASCLWHWPTHAPGCMHACTPGSHADRHMDTI